MRKIDSIKTPSLNLAVYQRGNSDAPGLAIVLPALLDTKDYKHIQSHVDFLAQYGFLAISFDPPGTWNSSGDIDSYTVTNYLKAVEEIIEHYGNRQTLLVGHSMGGRIALLAAKNNPAVTEIVMIMFSATPIRINNQTSPDAWKQSGHVTTYRERPDDSDEKVSFDVPYSFYEDAQRYTLTNALESLTIPKLFIIGTDDTAIPAQEAKATYNAALPKTLREIRSGHNYRRSSEAITEINQTLILYAIIEG